MRIVLLLLIAISANGYNSSRDDTARLVSDRYNKAMADYQGGSVEVAERALVHFIGVLSEAKKKHPGDMDYENIEGIVRLRLSGIYKEIGNTSMESAELNNATILLRDRLGDVDSDFKRKDQLKLLLYELENNMPPKWKEKGSEKKGGSEPAR